MPTQKKSYKTSTKSSSSPSRIRSQRRFLRPRFVIPVAAILAVAAVGTYLQVGSNAYYPSFNMNNTRDRLTQCRDANVALSVQASAPAGGSSLSSCTLAVQNLLNYYDQTKAGHAVPIDGWYQSFDADKISSYKYYRMNITGSRVVDTATYSNMIAYMNERLAAANAQKPNADNTGVPAGHTLSVPVTNTVKGISVASNGTVTISKGGTFENMLIKGRLLIKASGVTIRYSRIEANPSQWDLSREPTSAADCRSLGAQKNTQAVNYFPGYTGLTIEDSDIVPARTSVWLGAGINGSNYTLRRVDISRTVDGAGIYSTGAANVLIENSYIHDLYYGLYDYDQNCGPTHSDGVQVHYGSTATIRSNTIIGKSNGGVKTNAAIQVNQNAGYRTSNLTIDGNWMDYGNCTVNVWDNDLGVIQGLKLTNNKYGKGQANVISGEPCAMMVETTTKESTSNTYTGNTWENGTTPTPTIRNGGS